VIPPPTSVDDGSYYSQYRYYDHHNMMMANERAGAPDDDEEEKVITSPPAPSAATTTPRTPSSSNPVGEGYARKVTPSSSSSSNASPGSDGESAAAGGSRPEADYDATVSAYVVASPERGNTMSTEASTASTPPVSNTSKKTGSADIITASAACGSSSSPSAAKFVTLQDQDVVCGRGAPTEYHIGNAHFRDLVRSYHTSYFCAKRSDKPHIAMKVLDILETRGARFVRREKATRAASPSSGGASGPSSSCWVVVSRKLAYEKVCQSLRDGAPEVQRQMLSSSQKIREAVQRERSNEVKQKQKGLDQQGQYYHAIESHGSYGDYNAAVGAPGPGDHDKENGYPPQN
jgi:hypothetical protein